MGKLAGYMLQLLVVVFAAMWGQLSQVEAGTAESRCVSLEQLDPVVAEAGSACRGQGTKGWQRVIIFYFPNQGTEASSTRMCPLGMASVQLRVVNGYCAAKSPLCNTHLYCLLAVLLI